MEHTTLLEILLLLLVIASWLYWLTAWYMTRAFFHGQHREELAGPDTKPSPIFGSEEAYQQPRAFLPPVSILKPVKGLDPEAYANFASFCQQDYPEFELLFGVATANDPAVPVIQQLQRDFPRCRIRLIVAHADRPNRKACILHDLAAQASHEVLAVSDSDMRVTPDYLRRVVAPLADPAVGLVTCLYKGERPVTFTARMEALHMGATFLPSVLVARGFLEMRFALGATVVLRRRDLDRIGGFAAVADYLADDYQIGVRIAELGLRVHLSAYVVTAIIGPTTLQEQWDREVRWARCNRVCRPLEYPGILLTFSTPLALCLLLVSGLSPVGWQALGGSVFLRWLIAWLVAGYTGDRVVRDWLLLLPIRDMLSALVWLVGGLGKGVTWRGESFLVQGDGRMVPAPPTTRHLSLPLPRT